MRYNRIWNAAAQTVLVLQSSDRYTEGGLGSWSQRGWDINLPVERSISDVNPPVVRMYDVKHVRESADYQFTPAEAAAVLSVGPSLYFCVF